MSTGVQGMTTYLWNDLPDEAPTPIHLSHPKGNVPMFRLEEVLHLAAACRQQGAHRSHRYTFR